MLGAARQVASMLKRGSSLALTAAPARRTMNPEVIARIIGSLHGFVSPTLFRQRPSLTSRQVWVRSETGRARAACIPARLICERAPGLGSERVQLVLQPSYLTLEAPLRCASRGSRIARFAHHAMCQSFGIVART